MYIHHTQDYYSSFTTDTCNIWQYTADDRKRKPHTVTSIQMARDRLSRYTCGGCLSYSSTFYLLHIAIHFMLYSPQVYCLTVASPAHPTMLLESV